MRDAVVESNVKYLNPYYEDFEQEFTRKGKKRKENKQKASNGLELKTFHPLNQNQKSVYGLFDDGYNLVLSGCAGTGKTFLSLYLSLQEILSKRSEAKRIIIVRSVVPSRDMGFLPGSITEKSKVYETPYSAMCSDFFSRGDAYQILKTKKLIEFTTTSFVRGQTWDNAIIIVDEFQNLSWQELHSVITRTGEGSRIIFSGDGNQDDLTSERYSQESGIRKFSGVLSKLDSFRFVKFEPEDIVRSGVVREYLEVCHSLNYC